MENIFGEETKKLKGLKEEGRGELGANRTRLKLAKNVVLLFTSK